MLTITHGEFVGRRGPSGKFNGAPTGIGRAQAWTSCVGALAVAGLGASRAWAQSVSGTTHASALCGASAEHAFSSPDDSAITASGECPATRVPGPASINDSRSAWSIGPGRITLDIGAHTDFRGTSDGAGSASADAPLTLTVNDLIFFDTVNPGRSGIVTASMNFDLAGFVVTQGASNCLSNRPAARASILLQSGGMNASGEKSIAGAAATLTGAFVGVPDDGSSVLRTTTSGGVSLATPAVLQIIVTLSADVLYCDRPPAQIGDASALVRLSLPCLGPVFNLPPGISASSAQLGIVDNRWIGGVCCPCPADFDGSGGTPDAADINAFFSAWLVGDPSADADCSGGTPDAADINTFFAAWLAGGC